MIAVWKTSSGVVQQPQPATNTHTSSNLTVISCQSWYETACQTLFISILRRQDSESSNLRMLLFVFRNGRSLNLRDFAIPTCCVTGSLGSKLTVQSPICETPLLCAEAECGLAGKSGDVQGSNKGRAPLLSGNRQSLSIRSPPPFRWTAARRIRLPW
ncbi:hypothetical protein B0H65DRAFT_447198 [Neurospora tetraspora]|uniref:Uncharacterized protein n=1 Tax=Neurospora tetraspora TaxID=94610 RepID=A0AAE0JM38_9PEZI|nr:hypothetical protein B0H65DRAFT_447198 [Neurospora tetraspora]